VPIADIGQLSRLFGHRESERSEKGREKNRRKNPSKICLPILAANRKQHRLARRRHPRFKMSASPPKPRHLVGAVCANALDPSYRCYRCLQRNSAKAPQKNIAPSPAANQAGGPVSGGPLQMLIAPTQSATPMPRQVNRRIYFPTIIEPPNYTATS